MSDLGSAMYSLSKKLKLLKKEIQDINREHYSDLENRVKDAHSALYICQSSLLANPTQTLACMEKEAHRKWLVLAEAEERFLQQRSRVKWLESGDSNTAVFHKMVAQRRSGNQIHYLATNDGSRLTNMEDVKAQCVGYFDSLFGGISYSLTPSQLNQITSLTTFRCSAASKELLQATVTAADIKREVFALPMNKTPGPDGYNGEFFKKTWDITGDDLTKAVLEFFRSGKLLKQWNWTAIWH